MSVLARISRSDVNTPGYDGLAFGSLLRDAQFEVAAHEHLKDHYGVRVPEEGETNIWNNLRVDELEKVCILFCEHNGGSSIHKTQLLVQFAEIHAALYQWRVPRTFSACWSHSQDPNPVGPFTFPFSPRSPLTGLLPAFSQIDRPRGIDDMLFFYRRHVPCKSSSLAG